MKLSIAAVALLAAVALSACAKGKPRHLPPDPFAAPPEAEAQTPTEGLSAGLARRDGTPGFFLDHIGAAVDPMNKPPAVAAAGQPMLLDGFGFDAAAKLPAKGVDVVIDGKAYGTRYGLPRGDVATYFKAPALAATGFRTVLPAGTVKPGAHLALVRVVAADGQGFYESPAVAFEVK